MKFYVAKTSDRLFSIKKEGIEIDNTCRKRGAGR